MEKIFGMDFDREVADIIAIGIPLGKNSEKILKFLRKASLFFETFDLEKERGIELKIFDEGNLKFKDENEITERVKKILNDEKIPLILSKSHLTSLFSIKAFDKNSKIIVFDAHADCKNNYLDERVVNSAQPIKLNKKFYNCSTWLRRLIENEYRNVAIVGLRACSEEEINFLKNNKILYITSTSIKKSLCKEKKRISDFTKNSKIYVSIDIDVFDPSIALAVENPEANGLNYQEFFEILNGIEGEIVGLDLVEISLADKKLMEITCSLGLKALFDLLLKLKEKF
ncbi:MAG: arginase family protein [Candidatus Aenigmatarchaeota archaeon]